MNWGWAAQVMILNYWLQLTNYLDKLGYKMHELLIEKINDLQELLKDFSYSGFTWNIPMPSWGSMLRCNISHAVCWCDKEEVQVRPWANKTQRYRLINILMIKYYQFNLNLKLLLWLAWQPDSFQSSSAMGNSQNKRLSIRLKNQNLRWRAKTWENN